MSLSNRLVLPIILSAIAVLAGCGSSGNSVTPPPSGAFSNTDFNGTYTFSISGSDLNGTLTMAGSLVACGCTQGTISGGSVDFDDPTGVAPAATIGSNSLYEVSKDGRGQARLFITAGSVAFPEIDVDFVLTSSSHGLIIRYDAGGSGSGTLDKQPSAVTQSALGDTPYAFSLFGATVGGAPLATVGAFTLNSSGAITTGVEDFNDAAVPDTALPLTGSVLVGSGSAPGTASLSTSFSGTPLSFDVYTIDATHLKLIENDSRAFLVGDVFTQPTTNVPAGNLVFTMSGLDPSNNLFTAGGLVTSDGTSSLSNGAEDVNDDGIVDNNTNPATPFPFSGSFNATGGGRLLVTLSGFAGGSLFAAYPSSGGILMMEIDTGLNAGVTSGVALTQQAGATVTASQGYGLNLTGEDVINVVELDEIAEFKTTSTAFTPGVLDENDGFTTGSSSVNGTYTVGSNGVGSASVNGNLQSIFFYAADSSTVLFISTDPNQAASGVFQVQITPAQSALEQPRAVPLLRAIPHAHKVSGRSKTLISPFRK